MSIDKLQGLRVKCSTVDEWLSGDIREDPIGAIEQGASKIDDYLIVAISSEGTVRNGSGDTIKMELMKILRGDIEEAMPYISIWYYRIQIWVRPSATKHIREMWTELRMLQRHETIFSQSVLEFPWKATPTTLLTKRRYLIGSGSFGRCPAR